MRTRRRVRFSLAGLLLVTTAIGLFLGYSQWRRQDLLRQVAARADYRVAVILPNTWVDKVWQRRPILAVGISPCDSRREIIESGLSQLRIRDSRIVLSEPFVDRRQ